MIEVEAITACENVCRDFSWIAPLASVLADLGTFLVGVGVVVGFSQFRRWRAEEKTRSQAEAAQSCLVAVLDVDQALKFMRHPGRTPNEISEVKSDFFAHRRRRVFQSEKYFDALQRAHVQLKIFIGIDGVSKAINDLYEVRNRVLWAIETLERLEHDVRPDNNGLKADCDRYINAHGEDDELGLMQSRAIKSIESALQPIARYEKH